MISQELVYSVARHRTIRSFEHLCTREDNRDLEQKTTLHILKKGKLLKGD